jgi:hypothetical protein
VARLGRRQTAQAVVLRITQVEAPIVAATGEVTVVTGGQATAVKVAAENGTASVAVGGRATAVKVAAQGGTCGVAAVGAATLTRVATQRGVTVAAVTSTGVAAKVFGVTGTTTTVAVGISIVQPAAEPALAPRRIIIVAGRRRFTAFALVVDNAASTVLVPTAAETGTSAAVFNAYGAARKVAVQTGSCVAATAARGTAAKSISQSGAAPAVAAARGAAGKRASQAGINPVVVTNHGTVVPAEVAAPPRIVVISRTAVGRAQQQRSLFAVTLIDFGPPELFTAVTQGGGCVVVARGTATVGKRTAQAGACVVVARGTATVGKRTAQAGACVVFSTGTGLPTSPEVPSFPVVASVGADYIGAATTSHVVDLPVGINSGDLLILFFTRDGSTGTVTFPAGLPWMALTGPDDAGTSQHYVQYRVAGSSEGTSIIVATSVSEEGCAKILRITGWHGTTPPAVGTPVTGVTSATPDPPTLNPVDWDVEDTLWIAWFGCNGTGVVSAYPADYTGNQTNLSQAAIAMGFATRELAAASDDPGTFTKGSSTPWSANTFAVRPAADGAPASPPILVTARGAP